MKVDLGYWWPFAQTAWGWTIATVGGLAAVYYGPRKMLETWDWYLDRFFDCKVREYLQSAVTFAYYKPRAGGVPQYAKPKTVSEIALATKFSEKRVLKCLTRLSKRKEVIKLGNDTWKAVIPPVLA
jgi:hypothetical protein